MAREQEIRANIEGDIKNFDDRQQFLNDEINSYKKIHDDLQARYSTAQKERQQEKNVSKFNFYLKRLVPTHLYSPVDVNFRVQETEKVGNLPVPRKLMRAPKFH